jgi:hypothetical protein
MSSRFTVVETNLNRAEFRWKWRRLLRHSLVLGVVLCFLVLGLGVAMSTGWVANKSLATTFFVLIATAGVVAWVVVLIAVLAGAPDRSWLAAAVERVDRRLLDRLNTLLFLERRGKDPQAEAFSQRIARQTQKVLAKKPAPPAFPASPPLEPLLAFVAVLTATILVYHFYSPWERMLAAQHSKQASAVRPETPLELALPATNNVEQNAAWGEVRITEPGSDLNVTKVDVVPLQIEAAANQSLKQVGWYSTVNGAEESPHELPPPAEPRYAVYQPTVYLDELHLSDWDVMTYYAKANTEKTNAYASEVYFLEVRPFREDILKMPGGENGKAYQCLNELSMLIGRQQHVIRQTHQHIQKPPEKENLQAQDRKKLSDAESDLSDSTQHLYAKMASEMENQPIGEALDNLAKAEKSLADASQSLDHAVMNEAQHRERSALSELIAARKMFQKFISEHPDAFAEPKEQETKPLADSSKKLNQIAEFRNEAKAAEEFVHKALDDQKKLEQQSKGLRSIFPKLGEQEQQLRKSLEDFQQQHPAVFKGTEPQWDAAQKAMAKAAESLQKKAPGAQLDTQQATQQLEKFDEALSGRTTGQQLANAYKLKQLLDQQIRKLEACANPGNKLVDADLQQTAGDARETINQLKKTAEQAPTRDLFGAPLRDSLSGQNKVDLDTKLLQLQQAQDDASKRQGAGEASQALGKVSQAFAQSEPKSLQMAQKNDALKPGGQDAFNQGMAELDSLLKQLENHRPVSGEDQAKQGHQALYNLQIGMRSLHGDNDRGNQILLQLDKMLKGEAPLELESLKKLMDELQHFSVETSEHLAKKDDQPEVTNIDPTRLPPAYRGRIQKYFQKLSE